MNDLIRLLKDNKVPFGLMSEEMQAALIKCTAINGPQVAQRFIEDDVWIDCKDNDFSPWYTYRLSPDYEDEPEIVECEIKPQGDHWHYRDGGTWFSLHEAFDRQDFIGFKFQDGSWHDAPIKPVGPEGKHWTGNITVNDIVSGRVQILHSTYVLFRRNKQE